MLKRSTFTLALLLLYSARRIESSRTQPATGWSVPMIVPRTGIRSEAVVSPDCG